VATDNLGGVVASSPVSITVGSAAAQIYFIHTDHLNTPRAITSGSGQLVWSWANDDPFGANVPNEDPSGLGRFSCNLRLPGQYFDKETNLHYNYARDYEADVGRYVQSDPIGLLGGVNTYIYPFAPLNDADPLGLAKGGRGGGNGAAGYHLSFLTLAVIAPVFPFAEYRGRSPCGAEDGAIFPNTFDGKDISGVCRKHDACYDKRCGIAKEVCDREWLQDIKEVCGYQPRCLLGGYAYYSAFRRFGESAFLKAREGCRRGECAK
jgi:RHS repeat-associated protein